jgi:hypothetical protein
MREINQKHPSLALDALILAAGAGLAILSWHFGARPGHPLVHGPGAVFAGIYVLYSGCLFFLSYFFPDSTYIVNFLCHVCEERSRGGKGRHMALLYFALALGFGGWLLLFGFGMF